MDVRVTEQDGQTRPCRSQWERNEGNSDKNEIPKWIPMTAEINQALERHRVVGSTWCDQDVPVKEKDGNLVAARRMYDMTAMTQSRQHFEPGKGWKTVSRLVEIRRIYVCGDPKDIHHQRVCLGLEKYGKG